MSGSIEAILNRAPVIPVVTLERLEDALPLARALLAGGIAVIEITLRSEVALRAAEAILGELPEAVVGLGTVLEARQLDAARDIGAAFAVSPGATPALLEAARRPGMPPLLPGGATPSEFMALREAGFRAMKFFPAEFSGGVGALKAVQPVLPDLVFCPTGGVGAERAASYLALDNVPCVGGSWIAPGEALAKGDWTGIEKRARAAAEGKGA